ncbi:hypothetical protein FRY74_05170 [Vicingus serpentipes]|jgi:hypothetical protein|uniref:Uncharacterized protein n=1 Tax=Vicingus serpentipes TaxID=1926625 RepID=A0A5C6RX77_9FLAO|nr:hypothetical protein [Vicingus serpentipes]TXB65962.1 hypothetical protein FRY74_05170 [Vicingus serpentipes]
MKKLIFILSAVSLIACKNGEKATKSDDMANAKQTEQTEQTKSYDLVLEFISKGAGIDHKLKTTFEDGLAKFNSTNKVDITPDISHWGREGETNLNFNLKNLSTSQKKAFLSFVKETIGDTDMVHIKNQ